MPGRLYGHPRGRTGYFVSPAVDGQPVTTISLTDPTSWTVDTLDFDWDVMRPTQVDSGQVDLTQSATSGSRGDHRLSGLTPLGPRDYPTYRGQSSPCC